MAFKQEIKLIIANPDSKGVVMSGLDVDFNIERSITFEENTAEFTIYNAKEDTRKEFLKEGNSIEFSIGHEDEIVGNIFIGNIVESKSFQNGSDWVTTLVGASLRSTGVTISKTYVNLSYGPNIFLVQPLKDLATALGLGIVGIENASIILPNGWNFTGQARDALKYCQKILQANDADLYRDNTEIVIYNTGTRVSRYSPVYLTYKNGLLSVREITEDSTNKKKNPKKIEFESLIISKLQPNGLIKISTDTVSGIFFVDKVTFQGDNYSGNSICVGEASE